MYTPKFTKSPLKIYIPVCVSKTIQSECDYSKLCEFMGSGVSLEEQQTAQFVFDPKEEKRIEPFTHMWGYSCLGEFKVKDKYKKYTKKDWINLFKELKIKMTDKDYELFKKNNLCKQVKMYKMCDLKVNPREYNWLVEDSDTSNNE